jgi:hypothetical protein
MPSKQELLEENDALYNTIQAALDALNSNDPDQAQSILAQVVGNGDEDQK